MLELPRLGCLNIHASLLPRWRGAAPIHRAIEAGDTQTGITIMQMDAGLDTGDMLMPKASRSAPTTPPRRCTIGWPRSAPADRRGACMPRRSGGLVRTPQPAEGVTYAHKVEKPEAAIDWAQPAEVIERRVRAFDPFPGAQLSLDGETLKLLEGRVRPDLGGRPAA